MAAGAVTKLLLLPFNAYARGVTDSAITAGGAVTFDAATQGGGLTFSHTCTGTDRYLTVQIAIASGTVSVSSMTYNGVAMALTKRTVSGSLGTELWGLVNPASGAHNVVITLSSGATTAEGAASFTNVDQTVPVGTNGSSSGAGATANGPSLTGPAGGMIVDAIACGNATVVAPTLQNWNDGGGDASGRLPATGSAQQTTWTVGSPPWVIAAGVLAGLTVSDTVARTFGKSRSASDTAVTNTDSPARALTASRAITDTGTTNTDSVAVSKGPSRALTDTGVSPGGPTSYLVDTFTRTVGSGGWGTADSGTGWATPATQPTAFSVNGSQGLIATAGGTTYRIFAGQSRTAIETRFTFSFPVATATSASLQLLPAIRVQDTSNLIRAQILLSATGALQLQIQEVVAGTNANIGGGIVTAYGAGGYVANEVWHCKVREQAGANGRVDAVIWKDGTSEPAYTTNGGSGSLGVFTSMSTGGGTAPSAGWTTGDFGITVSSGAGNPSTTITIDDFSANDTATGVTDIVVPTQGRSLTDTGTTASDSAVGGRTFARTASDTGTTTSDSIAAAKGYARAVSDQGVAGAVTNYLTDTFTRTTGSGGWGTADSGTGWATPVTNPTGFSTDGNSGLVAYTGGAQNRILAGQSRADVEFRFQFSFPVAQATSASLQLFSLVRVQDVNNVLRGQIVLGTAGSLTCQVQQVVASTSTNVGSGAAQNALNNGGYVANQVWNCALRLSGQQFDIKIWKQGVTEPDYNVSNSVGSYATDSTVFSGGLTGTAATWTVGDFGFHMSPGAGNPSGTLKIDNVDVDSIGQVDSVSVSVTSTHSYSYTPSDTGATISDSVAPRRAWARTASDTAVTASDTSAVSRNRVVAATDTATTTTDSTKRLVARSATDTGTTTSDTVAPTRSWARAASDTATTTTDSVARGAYTWARATSDTAATPSDTTAIIRNWARPLTDSATSISDTTKRLVAHAASDTGTTTTDATATLRTRAAADTGTTTTDSVSAVRVRARAITDTGTTTTDSTARFLAALRASSDTGATLTDTVSRIVLHGVSDTAATITDSVARVAYAWLRSISDTAATLTDSVVATRAAINRSATDTGLALSDTTARFLAAARTTSDTATAISDTTDRLLHAARTLSDTGIVSSDSVVGGRIYTRPLSDTAVNPADTAIRSAYGWLRATSDTATAISDSATVTRIRARSAADTGTTITDTTTRAAALARAVSDTGVSGSDSSAQIVLRSAILSDTAISAADTVARNAYTWLRATSDTGATSSDSAAVSAIDRISVSDTGATISDTVARTGYGALLTDQGANVVGDHAARTFIRTGIVDTAATITDTPRVGVRRVPLVDQGASITDSVAPRRARATADTAATITDSVARAAGRAAADTATTITDLVQPSRGALLVDQGVTLSDSPRKHAYYTTADVGAAILDTLVGGPIRVVPLTDTATTITDSAQRSPGYVIFDTGAVTDEALHRRVWRYILDTGTTPGDIIRPPGFVAEPSVGTATTSESLAASILVGVSAIYTMSAESRAYAVAVTLDAPGATTDDYALVGVTTSEE